MTVHFSDKMPVVANVSAIQNQLIMSPFLFAMWLILHAWSLALRADWKLNWSFFHAQNATKSGVTRFFYTCNNKLYKNTQTEICPKIKNKLKTITRAEILMRQIQDIHSILVTQIEMYLHTKIRGHCIQ